MAEPEPKRPPPPKSYVPLIIGDEPTPILPPRPQIEGEDTPVCPPHPDSKESPVPRPRSKSNLTTQERSESPIPVRPERRKTKKASSSAAPVPYIAPTTTQAESESKEVNDSHMKSPSPKPAQRNTLSEERAKPRDITESFYAPPDTLIDSLYTEVKKPKRYPAPNMPAPPPPNEDSPKKSALSIASAPSKPAPRPARAPPSRPSRPPAVSPAPASPSSSQPLSSPKHTASTSVGKPQTAKKRRPEITIVSAQPMSGDIIPSPPISPQYEQLPSQPSPPTTRKSIKRPATEEPSHPPRPQSRAPTSQPAPPIRPARPSSANTQPKLPSRATGSAPSRPPPAIRPPPPQLVKKPPPEKPKPFAERKTKDAAKSIPTRPTVRPAPPTAVSRLNKAAALGPPPDEDPPEPPTDADEHELKMRQHTIEENSNSVSDEIADAIDNVPVSLKRHPKMAVRTVDPSPDEKPTLNRAPPPRPSTNTMPQSKTDEAKIPEAHHRKPPQVKRPPPPKASENDLQQSAGKPSPVRPPAIKRPPMPISRSTDKIEQSVTKINTVNGKESTESPENLPTKPARRPTRPTRPPSIIADAINKPKETASPHRDIDSLQNGEGKPPTNSSLSEETATQNKDTGSLDTSKKTLELEMPPISKSPVHSDPSSIMAVSMEASLPERKKSIVEPSEKPVDKRVRPPLMKKPPRPKSQVVDDPKDSTQETDEPIQPSPPEKPATKRPRPLKPSHPKSGMNQTDEICSDKALELEQTFSKLQNDNDDEEKQSPVAPSESVTEDKEGSQEEKDIKESTIPPKTVSRPPPPKATKKEIKDVSPKEQKSPSVHRPSPPRSRAGSTARRDKHPPDEPVKIQKSPSISRPHPPKTNTKDSKNSEPDTSEVRSSPKRPPSIKRPPPPKQKSVQLVGDEQVDISEEPTDENSPKGEKSSPPPKRPPTVSRPPPPKAAKSSGSNPASIESVETSSATKQEQLNQQENEDVSPKEQKSPSVHRPSPPRSRAGSTVRRDKHPPDEPVEIQKSPSISRPHPPKTNTKEVMVDANEVRTSPKRPPSIKRPPPPKQKSVQLAGDEQVNISKESTNVQSEDRSKGEKSSPPPKRLPAVSRPPPPKVAKSSGNNKESQAPTESIETSSTTKREELSQDVETTEPTNRLPKRLSIRIPPPPKEPKPPSPATEPQKMPDSTGVNESKASVEEGKVSFETDETSVVNASEEPPKTQPEMLTPPEDHVPELTEESVNRDSSELANEDSSDAAVLEAVCDKEETERLTRSRQSRGSMSTSALKSSIKRQEEEEGGIRIIRYDKKETSFESSYESSGVALRKPSSKPKPPRPVSMPPQPSKESGNKEKPARPPPIKEKSEKPKPPRPGPPPSSKAPSTRPPPAKTLGGHRPARKLGHPEKEQSGPPPLPVRPTPGHPLYRYVCSEPHGLATAHYDATADDEISYMEGDVIELIEKLDNNWYFARNTDLEMAEGLILARNLKIIKKLPGSNTVAGFEEGPCAIATSTFTAQSMDELSFNEGALIMLKAWVGQEWLRGKLINGDEGIFPKSFVEIVEELPPNAVEEPSEQTTSAESTADIREPHCVALHPFTAEGPDELSISPGDVIMLVSSDGEWLRGKLAGREGIFPASFVEVKIELSPHQEVKASSLIVVTATFDYDGQEGDLSFKAGDKITLLSRVNEEWVVGELADNKGMLPVSFIDSNPDTLPPHKEEAPAKTDGGSEVTGECEVLFDFDGDASEGELSFRVGDVIITTEWVNEEWIRGSLKGQTGMFPVSFVKIIKELPKSSTESTKAQAPQSSSKAQSADKAIVSDDLMPRAVALFDYQAGSSDEISFKEGDSLYLFTRIDKDWFEGENVGTASIGQFPANYVDVIVPLP